MKKSTLIIAITAVAFVACRKENLSASQSRTVSQNKTASLSLNPSSDPRIGTILKWKCFGGDTLFNDTLKMKLESISFSSKKKVEVFYYSFNQPIWANTEFVCTEQDLQQITQLAFTSPDCKTAYFLRLN